MLSQQYSMPIKRCIQWLDFWMLLCSNLLDIWWLIVISFSKHFHGRRFEIYVMKIASTAGEMFENTFSSYCCHNLRHLCLENTFPDVKFSVHHLILQSLFVFSSYLAFLFNIIPKMNHFCDSIHFHEGRLRFQHMNVQSTTVDLISNLFMT